MKSKNVILIKLGGSVITDKAKERTANLPVIRQLAKEIAQARNETNNLFIIAHGQGSFAHRSAAVYKTIDGLTDDASKLGLAKVHQDCLTLHKIVLDELIAAGIPAVTIEPFATITAKNKTPDELFLPPFLNALSFGLVPIVFGDVISDKVIGSTIYSGETVLNLLAEKLHDAKTGLICKMVIEVGKTEGVLNENGQTIAKITQKNYRMIKKLLKGSDATDVTGGMLHKVDEALKVAKISLPTLLISSMNGHLLNAISNKPTTGTWVR